ncbi:MAG TPA: F0F1 ATP synthase subunit alpha [Armatimonadetes bacterium]|nr:F0F1 ATP synthase subunit alpha [Armatimonadota bacterium]
MSVRSEEVRAVLDDRLAAYKEELELTSTGIVLQVGDGIAQVYGLSEAMSQELIDFGHGIMGIALNLEEDTVGCVLLGPDDEISEGDQAHTTGLIAQTKVGEALFGRVVNPLAEPLDFEEKGPLEADETRPLEVIAPGVVKRQPVHEPLLTGIKAIDAAIPIGRGQRELIIGDRQTGKTQIALDAIVNQRGSGVKCVYVAVGQKMATIRRLVATLEREGAMEYTCVVAATASDPAPMQYIAPYAGCAIGEWVRDQGGHALLVYDDLSKHAQAYRQMSLLLRRPPGREAYPGDIFNLHSRLLERAAKMSDGEGAGSLTALPIVETQEGDFSAYIPTNVVSITDGQIYLESRLFHEGQRPAINIGMSVSRVGSDAQSKMMKQVGSRLKLDLASYREYEAFAQFGADLDEDTQKILAQGQRMVEVLKQPPLRPMDEVDQVIVLFAATRSHLADVPVADIAEVAPLLIKYVHDKAPDLTDSLRKAQVLSDEDQTRLADLIETFKREWRLQYPTQ